MEHFMNRVHVRRESQENERLSKRDLWREDEIQVREGACEFPVKYLGYMEVLESNGPDVCQHAFHKLKHSQHCHSLRGLFQGHQQNTGNHRYATFMISKEGLRIVDEFEDVLADTPLQAISFCCPIKDHHRGFAYICRSDKPWLWYCHAMEALDDQGDRLNNAVSVAFHMCFEKRSVDSRNRRRSSGVAEEIDPSTQLKTSGSFRKVPLAKKQIGPQTGIAAESVPRQGSDPPSYLSIDSPRGPTEVKQKKGSSTRNRPDTALGYTTSL